MPAQLHALGVDEASLKKANPHVIMSLFSAFGGPGWGPKSDHVGYDDLVQVCALVEKSTSRCISFSFSQPGQT